MGIYIFSYKKLRKYLLEEAKIERDEHDFGKHILPKMLADNQKMVAYEFNGYWKDVGTIDSLWQANMDLLDDNKLDIFNEKSNWKIYSEDTFQLPQYIASDAIVTNSLINQGCIVEGEVHDSVIFGSVTIEKGAVVNNSVIMPNTVIKSGAHINKAIIANDLTIDYDVNLDSDKVVLVGE